MLAMVLGALAPTVAQAMVAASGQGEWVEVCSASGMVWLKADAAADVEKNAGGAQAPASPMADMVKHCAWCSLHGAAAGLPPSVSVDQAFPPVTHSLPAFAGASLSRLAWRSAQARAPPLVS